MKSPSLYAGAMRSSFAHLRGLAAFTFVSASLLAGCEHPTCAGSEDPTCHTQSPCRRLAYACSDGRATVRTLQAGDAMPTGLDALASPGDVMLENDQVRVVIDAIGHPHYVAPTGGTILDLARAEGGHDALTQVFHAVGLLPGDSVAYSSLFIDEQEEFVAVEVRGVLAGKPNMHVATRYELRPCEPGVRVRTEVLNAGNDPDTWALVDAWYWSGRETLPFAPGVGTGFIQPGLTDPLNEAWREQRYFAAASHSDQAAAYGEVACEGNLYGWHTEQLSAVGPMPRVVPPRDVQVFERFIVVDEGRDVSRPINTLLQARALLFGEPFSELRGQVIVNGDSTPLGDEARATVRIVEGTESIPEAERRPWTQVTPEADGTWSVLVPRGRDYLVQVDAFGRDAGHTTVSVLEDHVDSTPIVIEPASALTVNVTIDGVEDHVLVFVVPADDATEEATRARLLGGFTSCAPLLGSPTGGSPACDRLLALGDTSFALPPGHWDIVATAGPFASLARQEVTLAPGQSERITLALETLDLTGEDTLSADFHVHGAASFDSTVPDVDRVQAFLAARIDVIAATDHDVVWDYADARRMWNADERMHVIVGLEATGHILFDLVPGAELPQVIGHWNVWPLAFDASAPYRGAPWDELAEPGLLMTRFVEAGWPSETGVVQLNHPWAPAQFGRDLGFPRAIGVDANEPLPRTDMTGYDGTGPGLLLRTPPGASFGNADYHTQEVMNGSENEDLLPYRAYWFYLLNQGIIRAGTANSDSHSLVDNVLGTPRTLVRTSERVATLDEALFNRSVREGRMTGTNGPVIEASIQDTSRASRSPSVRPFIPMRGAMLSIRVTAAPWVPVDEIRIVINGQVERTLARELMQPMNIFGTDGLVRFEGEIALAELGLDGTRDAWIVVEAGEGLPLAGDLDCDGIPDTGDNTGDDVVDYRDVDRNDDDVVDARDIAGLSGAACERGAAVGPMARTPRGDRDARRWGFGAVTPHGYAYSFTNPLLLDWDGDGFRAPGLRGAR